MKIFYNNYSSFHSNLFLLSLGTFFLLQFFSLQLYAFEGVLVSPDSIMFPFHYNHTPLKRIFLQEETAPNKFVSKEKRYLLPQEENSTSNDVEENSIIQRLNKNSMVRPIEEEILYSWYLIQNDADIIRNVTKLKQSDKYLLQNLALQHLPLNNNTNKENVVYKSKKNKDEVKLINASVSDDPLLLKSVETHSSLGLNSSNFLKPHFNVSTSKMKNKPSLPNNQEDNFVSKYTQNSQRNSLKNTHRIDISDITETLSDSQIQSKSHTMESNVSQKDQQVSNNEILQIPLHQQRHKELFQVNDTIQLQYEGPSISSPIKLNNLLLLPYNQSQNVQLYLLQILPKVNVSTLPNLKEIENPLLRTANDRVHVSKTLFQTSSSKSSSNLSKNNSVLRNPLKTSQHSITENLLTPVKSTSVPKLRQSTNVNQKDNYKKQHTLLVICVVLISGSILVLCGLILFKTLCNGKKPLPSLKRTKTFILCEKSKVHFSDDSIPSCTTNDTMETECAEGHYAKERNSFCETPTIHLNIVSHVDTNQTMIPKSYPLKEMIHPNKKTSDFHLYKNLQNTSLFTMSRCKRPFSAIQILN